MPKVLLGSAAKEHDHLTRTMERIVKLTDMRQADIAAAVGVTPMTLNRWMHNPESIPLKGLRKLLSVCHADVTDVLDIVQWKAR